MEDLRQTALAYYTAAKEEIQSVVKEFYLEMYPNDVGYVKFKEFSKYMEAIKCNHMSSDEFFDELKQPGNDGLYFDDVITLFYIIHSGRPFCGGSCKRFIKGIYFTCVKCFEDTECATTFSVCSQCFTDKKYYQHQHDEFLDPIVLLHFKRLEAQRKGSKSSSTVDQHSTTTSTDSTGKRVVDQTSDTTSQKGAKKTKYEGSPPSAITMVKNPDSHDKPAENTASSSVSTSILPAVNQQSKQAKLQTAIQFGQLVASIGSIVVASQLCAIM